MFARKLALGNGTNTTATTTTTTINGVQHDRYVANIDDAGDPVIYVNSSSSPSSADAEMATAVQAHPFRRASVLVTTSSTKAFSPLHQTNANSNSSISSCSSIETVHSDASIETVHSSGSENNTVQSPTRILCGQLQQEGAVYGGDGSNSNGSIISVGEDFLWTTPSRAATAKPKRGNENNCYAGLTSVTSASGTKSSNVGDSSAHIAYCGSNNIGADVAYTSGEC